MGNNDFYVCEYRRLMDNINISDDSLLNITDNIEKMIINERNSKKKQIIAASAALVVVGMGVKLVMDRRR